MKRKKKNVLFLMLMFVLTVCFTLIVNGCISKGEVIMDNYNPVEKEQIFIETRIPAVTSTFTFSSTATLEPTPTFTSTSTPTPIFEAQRQRIRGLMEEYGDIQEYYLTDDYWEKLYNDIARFGVASRVVAFELHGNNYNMYGGAYSLSPEAFYNQISYLMQNEYHFVTIHELRGFVEGWLDLPKRSVVLTTDSGNTSLSSNESIIKQFTELEERYGYKPHIESFIWTWNMGGSESSKCKDDSCWESFRVAKSSGFFSFGTHSESHRQFGFETRDFLYKDLKQSIDEIYENMAIRVYSISWPHESCSKEFEALNELGIVIGFGGLSKPEKDSFVYKGDTMNLCLPRLFPPNGGSEWAESSRPLGFTLQEILELQSEP